jgi:hypothetical protein
MELVEIVLTVCALSQPARCEEQRLQFQWNGSLAACVMGAEPYIAQWIGEHPRWAAARWHCEYAASRKRKT